MKAFMKIRTNTKDVSDLNNLSIFEECGYELAKRKSEGSLRTLSSYASRDSRTISSEDGVLVNFSSNDYLGLSAHPKIAEAWRNGLKLWGSGSGASALVTGRLKAHAELEEELCDWLGYEKAILFNSGFAANQAVIKTFCKSGRSIVMDRLAHASLQEAAHLSGAKLLRFHHNDADSCHRCLEKAEGPLMTVTEGVFSMDGDEAPVEKIISAAQKNNSAFFLDDAHGIGVHGKSGCGTCDKQGIQPNAPHILMGTFGKALGTMGAFVASSACNIEYMVNFAREYVYSTHMPPAAACATLEAVRLARSSEGDDLRQNLRDNVACFRNGLASIGLEPSGSTTSIQPVIIGDSEGAVTISSELRKMGFLAGAIRPPTVPAGTARLRITVTAAHSKDDIDGIVNALSHLTAKKRD